VFFIRNIFEHLFVMVVYQLDHLTQPPTQEVMGPIQDDEALVLFALIKCMRLWRVFEIGGLGGYSARNFLRAVGPQGTVYTVDLNPVPSQGPNHKCIQKNALDITFEDLDNAPLDLVFFDCHDMVQMDVFARLKDKGLINDSTVLALHDTNLHYQQFCNWAPPCDDGWAHQPVEREMVNQFKEAWGYDVFCYHTEARHHDLSLPFRHGLTVCKKFFSLSPPQARQ
jgi:hypothetical protein